MGNFKELVTKALPELVFFSGEPMAKHTTFGIGGPAEYYAVPTKEELAPLLQLAEECGLSVTVIGNGSNLLVSDAGIRGLVVEIGAQMNSIHVDGNKITAEAGALLSKIAQTAAAAGLGGLEFAAGIPGNLGGALVMNAGAYGGEMRDVIESAVVMKADGQLLTLSCGDLEFGYRKSCIPNLHGIAVSAVFALAPEPEEEIRARMAALREKRMEKQPLEYPSAGSTFKRPEGCFAGKLIMDAGLRGYTVGGAQVSEKHCGFVINRGGATAADVCRLMRDVRARVKECFGVVLEPEVKLLGEGMNGELADTTADGEE